MNLKKEHFELSALTSDDVKAFLRRYENDPVLFAREILLLEPDDNQIRILNAVASNDYDFTAVASGRGIGKTITISMASIWFLATQPGAKIIATSNTDQQSKRTLFPPMVSMLKGSLIESWFEYSTEMIHFKGDRDTAFITRLVWSEHNVEAVSGFHAKNMLYVCDEASKYPNIILENFYASCTESNNKMLLTTNPTRASGFFYDTRERDNWQFLEIDSRSSRFTDKAKIQELIDQYGEDSDKARVQVKGQFPKESTMTIISPDILSRAMTLGKPNIKDNWVVSIGLDVGGGGDPSCWVVRKGLFLLDKVKFLTKDEDKILSTTQSLVAKYNADYVIFDKTGLGHFLQPRLKSVVSDRVKVLGVNFGESSMEADCVKMRDWIYRRLSDWFVLGGVIGNDNDLKRQLQATEYTFDDKGRIKLIPKKIIKRELNEESPDDADALALSCAYMGNLEFKPITSGIVENDITRQLMEAGQW